VLHYGSAELRAYQMQTLLRARHLWGYLRSPRFRLRLKRYIASPVVWFGRSAVSHFYICLLVAVVAYAGWQGWQRATVIAPFQLPPENREQPLPFSGETVADTLLDGFSAIQSEAQGLGLPAPCDQMATKHESFAGVVYPPSPAFEVIGRPIAEVKGISVEAAISVAREILGHEQEITGDVVLVGPDQFELMARARNLGPWNAGPFPLSLEGLKNAGCTLAEEILGDTNKNLLAAALIRRADYQRVINLYHRMPTDPKELPDAYNNLAVALAMSHSLNAAKWYLGRAIKLRSEFPEALFNLGNVLYQESQGKGAEAEYRAALRLKPDYAEAHSNLGIVLDESHHLRGAQAEYRAALRLKPGYAEVHSNLCSLLSEKPKKNDLEAAEPECREAIRLKPDYAMGHYNLGVVLYEESHLTGVEGEHRAALLKGAEAEYRAAVGLKPDYGHAHLNLGGVLYEESYLTGVEGEHRAALLKGAEAEYRAAVGLMPDDAETRCDLGTVLEERGSRASALKEYRRALNLDDALSAARKGYERLSKGRRRRPNRKR
jgi:Flp pilus assembly protein TadD